MKKIKWILILLVLAVIGSFLPENEPEGISYSASSEETNDWEENDLEESQGGEKEVMRFSEDSRTNRDIVVYNEQNPDNAVELDMVENWETGDGIATRVTFEGFCIQFGHNEGVPVYALWSDNDNNEKNKDAFILESLKWFKAIYGFEDWELDDIRNHLSEDSSEIKFDTYMNLEFQENGLDFYLERHTYVIRISPKP